MRKSKDSSAAKDVLMSPTSYNLTSIQADAILNLRLNRLTSLEVNKLESEHEDLTQQIIVLNNIMLNDALVYDMMINETLEIKG